MNRKRLDSFALLALSRHGIQRSRMNLYYYQPHSDLFFPHSFKTRFMTHSHHPFTGTSFDFHIRVLLIKEKCVYRLMRNFSID